MAAVKVDSSMLICEASSEAEAVLKDFCLEHDMSPLRVSENKTLLEVLSSSVEMGGISISEDYAGDGLAVAKEAHRLRPALPIFMRSNTASNDYDQQPGVAGVYQLESLSDLKGHVDKYIFNTWYPERLIRRIQAITEIVLKNQFIDADVTSGMPYLIMDNRIYGELMSLIPVECEWCRGFMLMQGEERPIESAIQAGKTFVKKLDYDDKDFRPVGNIMGEVTNMVWGAMKNELFTSAPQSTLCAQVPIIISHTHELISFGTDIPQLCFQYLVKPHDESLPEMTFYEKFVFNLDWSPERFNDVEQVEDELGDVGSVELF